MEHLQLFTGILRDISRRKELERKVVEIAALEQQRIGMDLHDQCGQELTALWSLCRHAGGVSRQAFAGGCDAGTQDRAGLNGVLRQAAATSPRAWL